MNTLQVFDWLFSFTVRLCNQAQGCEAEGGRKIPCRTTDEVRVRFVVKERLKLVRREGFSSVDDSVDVRS